MDMKLIFANLKRFSVQAVILLTLINSAYLGLPVELQAQIPAWVGIGVNFALGLFGYIGRQMPQPEVEAEITELKIKAANK